MNIHRRHFLRATGISLALPWLEAFAAPGVNGPPRRMVCIVHPCIGGTAVQFGNSLWVGVIVSKQNPAVVNAFKSQISGDGGKLEWITFHDPGRTSKRAVKRPLTERKSKTRIFIVSARGTDWECGRGERRPRVSEEVAAIQVAGSHVKATKPKLNS